MCLFFCLAPLCLPYPTFLPDIDGWGVSPRGAGFLFGADIVAQFNHTNQIDLVARAHQLVMEGHKLMFDNRIVTVWSGVSRSLSLLHSSPHEADPRLINERAAPNYCYRCGNVASILELDEDLNQEYKTFVAAPQDAKGIPAKRPLPEYCAWASSSSISERWRWD
jgi:serine/threonine-protein phosphatase 4 catalytic subunit